MEAGTIDLCDDCWEKVFRVLGDSLSISLLALTCHRIKAVAEALRLYHPSNLKYVTMMRLAVRHGYPEILDWLTSQRKLDEKIKLNLIIEVYTALSSASFPWLEKHCYLRDGVKYGRLPVVRTGDYSKAFTIWSLSNDIRTPYYGYLPLELLTRDELNSYPFLTVSDCHILAYRFFHLPQHAKKEDVSRLLAYILNKGQKGIARIMSICASMDIVKRETVINRLYNTFSLDLLREIANKYKVPLMILNPG